MSQQENEGTERFLVEVEELEETLRLVEQYSPQSPYFDNVQGHQGLAELNKVRDWAKGMEKIGHSITGVRLNLDESGKPDDPPDVLAEMDGKPIGIEVTDLMKYLKGAELCILSFGGMAIDGMAILRSKQRQNGRFEHRWSGAELDPDAKARREREVEANPDRYRPRSQWTLEQFQTELAKIVEKKDKKAAQKAGRMRKYGENALGSRLHASFLLIFTSELHLGQHRLADYLEQAAVPRPESFDRVFLMGYEPRAGNPVFEVRLIG